MNGEELNSVLRRTFNRMTERIKTKKLQNKEWKGWGIILTTF